MNYECQTKVSKSRVSLISKTSKGEKMHSFFGDEQARENMCAKKSTQDMWRLSHVTTQRKIPTVSRYTTNPFPNTMLNSKFSIKHFIIIVSY